MRKLYPIGSNPYCLICNSHVEVLFSKSVEEGANIYLVRERDEDGHSSFRTVIENHSSLNRYMFDDRESCNLYLRNLISERKRMLLEGDEWIRVLFSEFCSSFGNSDIVEREAIRQIIRERLNIEIS